MNWAIIGAVASASMLAAGCSMPRTDAGSGSSAARVSIHTSLDAKSCRKEIEKSDPNETPYLLCPGIGGYSLIVRTVDAGRDSIDVVDANGRVLPLRYDEFVTRHMSALDGRVEWRAVIKDGAPVPMALIVRVLTQEDPDNPETVTGVRLAVAKIAPPEVCVTDAIPAGTITQTDLLRAADSAFERPCAPPQPPMMEGGTVIR